MTPPPHFTLRQFYGDTGRALLSRCSDATTTQRHVSVLSSHRLIEGLLNQQ